MKFFFRCCIPCWAISGAAWYVYPRLHITQSWMIVVLMIFGLLVFCWGLLIGSMNTRDDFKKAYNKP